MNTLAIPPCFYCEKPAEYTGEVVEHFGIFSIVEVCKDHYKNMEASSWNLNTMKILKK